MAEDTAPDSWLAAQEMVDIWPDVSADFPVSGTCRRLRDALLGLPASTAGWLDVAVLIRQVLLEQDAQHGKALPLRVPATPPFPRGDNGPTRAARLCPPLVGSSLLLQSPGTLRSDQANLKRRVPRTCAGCTWAR